ncbi:DNA recombination protein RmuC [Rariglobus hedericola]|uniref:DNA recombination protein RmuC n=1 Tax=Rariglobus hedericola TaxID=2597822 RepID=A0A556QQ52_9BACT|nr:DNA recombination protein RmuC [Rariglobus hedericola]TSJ78760.1 DNA recombination protein RmuC [Rariglobus hedericola]
MTLLFVLIAAVVGAITAWLFLNAQLGERLRARESDIARITAALAAAESSVAQLSTLNTQLSSSLAADRASFSAQLAAGEQRLAERETLAARYLADAEKLKATLQTEFQVLAGKILDEKSAKFTEHNKTQVENILHPLRQQLTDFRQRVDLVYKSDGEDRTALKTQIEQLRQLNVRITDEARALTTALKGQSQARGAWGELILERLLDSAGLIKGQDYLTQESLTTDDGRRLRPDVILRLPDARHLVIDSKVSLIAYERAVNATEDLARTAATTEHARAVRTHVEQLSEKKYEDTGKLVTPDYVLMFVPLEPAFTLALETDRQLYEWAFDRRVILCTAPTLLVTLKTVASLWKQDRQTKNVQAIADRGGALYDKFAGLIDDLESLGLQLGRSRESYDAAMSKLKTGKGNLIAQVEDLKKLGAKAKKSLPASDTTES